jgi:hypothetical protein
VTPQKTSPTALLAARIQTGSSHGAYKYARRYGRGISCSESVLT